MELAQFQVVEVESFKTAICGDVLNITGSVMGCGVRAWVVHLVLLLSQPKSVSKLQVCCVT
jgi:hypothetical protein